jgi:hypothetical protein
VVDGGITPVRFLPHIQGHIITYLLRARGCILRKLHEAAALRYESAVTIGSGNLQMRCMLLRRPCIAVTQSREGKHAVPSVMSIRRVNVLPENLRRTAALCLPQNLTHHLGWDRRFLFGNGRVITAHWCRLPRRSSFNTPAASYQLAARWAETSVGMHDRERFRRVHTEATMCKKT